MNYRICAVCILLAALVLPLTSCGSGHSGENYVLIAVNVRIPYWQSAAAGFSEASRQLGIGYSFVGPDSYDPAAERDELLQAIQKKPAGILISVADPKTVDDGIYRAIDAGIPVITIDSDAPESKRLFFVGTNNYQAGLIGGKRLVQELKGKGNVVVFTMPSQPNLNERFRGYKDAIQNYPDINIAGVVDIRGDPRVAFDSTTQILSVEKKQHIDAFVCLEALSGKEVANVLNSRGIKGKTIIAMDTDPDTLNWIQKGVIAATISQKPYTMAFVGLKMLDDLHHSGLKNLGSDWAHDSFAQVPAFVDTGSALVDKSNVDAFIAATKSLSGK
jgi:ribose transport system substrate-binding protein